MTAAQASLRPPAKRALARGLVVMLAVIECVVVAAFIVAALELMSRAFHLGRRPMIPYVADAGLAPRMPGGFDATIKFPGGAPFAVCTDAYGLRMADCAGSAASAPSLLLTVGDSQAFGWGMEFSETFTAHVANALGGSDSTRARIMAVAGADVESQLSWARDYRATAPPTPRKLNVITVNLGNDLDEMYFGRSIGTVPLMKGLREWLTVHSYFMLDFTLVKNSLLGITEWKIPPGTNPVLFTLNREERDRLANATVDSVDRLARALPPAERTVILVLPNDYQVAPEEFSKYRSVYPSEDQYQGWQRRVTEASMALDRIESILKTRLSAEGYAVAAPRQRLMSLVPSAMIDRSSHHFTPAGQRVLADSILEAIAR